jgi:hypothetical protein
MRAARLLLCIWMGACHRGDGGGATQDQEMATPEQHPDEHAAMAAEHAMAGRVSNEDLHLRLTAVRPAATGDSTRAAEILTIMRRELAKYRDVRVAQDDGFRNFIPTTAAPIQHFTKIRWAMESRSRLDPARPTSLLYQRDMDGNLVLVGAMFTAPAQATEEELDSRLPLSIARWHQHINWCLPPLADARRRWRETKNGQPVFGPKSPIATADACEAVGGRFRPRLFGWMVHVMALADGDPWNAHHH